MARDKFGSGADDRKSIDSAKSIKRPFKDKAVLDQIAAIRAEGRRGREAPPRRPAVVDNGD